MIKDKRFFKYIDNFILDFKSVKRLLNDKELDGIIKQLEYIKREKTFNITMIDEVIKLCVNHKKDFSQNRVYNEIMDERKYILDVISKYFYIEYDNVLGYTHIGRIIKKSVINSELDITTTKFLFQ